MDDKRFVMTLKELKTYFVNSLLDFYPETEISSFFYLLTEDIIGMTRIETSIKSDTKISELVEQSYQDAIDKLKTFEPIQYIIGETECFNLPFKVNPSVLIPRPETEELIDWIISKNRPQKTEFKILDIGTGSGCIAIALSKNLSNSHVIGLDVSKDALSVAKENARCNEVDVEFIHADILTKNLRMDNFKFDIIVSNPPYVRSLEKAKMQPNVLEYEPHIALFVENDDALLFYRKITQFAKKTLKFKGQLFFEINEYLGKNMIQLLKDEGFVEIELKQDMYGKDRMIKGVKS
jgi:release factor glutamine methyltransferase